MPFTFLPTVQASPDDEVKLRLKIQALSDMYKAMQARLDGYRQSAGAVFLALIAAALTFDSAFVRIFFDSTLLTSAQQDKWLSSIISGGGGGIIVGVCLVSLSILRRLSEYFAEMTSVVYKIDEANGVWEPNAWLQGTTLYPLNFQIDPANHHGHLVSRSSRDSGLLGWYDPAIGHFRALAVFLLFFHMFFYGAILWRIWT